jgi:uncharacterized membrane protein HdeD (DUF308 family)
MTAAVYSAEDRIDSMNATLAQNWWIVALRGVLAILFGIAAFVWPGLTILSMVFLFAGYSIVDGALGIALAIRGARRGERWVALLVMGILGLIAGIVSAVWPAITVVAFVLVMAFWAAFTGILLLAAAFDVKRNHGRGWLVLGGIVSVAYGVLLLIAPLLGALVLTWWVGAHALVLGGTLLVLAFRLRKHRGEIPHRAAPARAA